MLFLDINVITINSTCASFKCHVVYGHAVGVSLPDGLECSSCVNGNRAFESCRVMLFLRGHLGGAGRPGKPVCSMVVATNAGSGQS